MVFSLCEQAIGWSGCPLMCRPQPNPRVPILVTSPTKALENEYPACEQLFWMVLSFRSARLSAAIVLPGDFHPAQSAWNG